MKKRLRKKIAKKRYDYMLNFMVDYCELPKEVVVNEYHDLMFEISYEKVEDEYRYLETLFIDCNSIALMIKYKSGWYYRDNPERCE